MPNTEKFAIILMARLGDVCNFLPVALDVFKRTGNKPDWYISLHFASIFGVSYVNPIKIQFAYERTDLAIALAEKSGATVMMAQTFGRLWRGRHDICYNRLAWVNTGYGEHFDDTVKFPLIFDRRDPEREARLCERVLTGTKPVLLLSIACGRSSPFAAHHLFSEAIKRKWETHFQIVDLCKTRASRVYDILGLMEKAALLVTGDSFAVHLAAAVQKLPVVFLCNNEPFLASDTRCNVVLRLRYAEWFARIQEVHGAIRNFVRS